MQIKPATTEKNLIYQMISVVIDAACTSSSHS